MSRLIFDRYVAALNARDTAALQALVADELDHNGERMTRQRWWDTQIAANLAAVPDFRWHPDEVLVVDDRVVVRYTDSGTPIAPWMGADPTGAAVRFREYVFYRIRDARITEVWGVFDADAIRAQLRA